MDGCGEIRGCDEDDQCSVKTFHETSLHLYHIPKLCRGHACAPFKVATEGGLVGESETVGDGLHRGIRLVGEHLLGRKDDEVLDPIAGAVACLLLDNFTEILRC